MLGWFKKEALKRGGAVDAFEPSLPLDLLHPDFVANPYPTYEWLRAHKPVAELAGGGYLLTRHADIIAAFTNPNLGNAPSRFSTLSPRNAAKYVAADLGSHIPPFLDGAEHRAMRQMITRAFFNTFNSFGADLNAIARDFVSKLRDGDDLIAQASQPFAVQTMCRFCGIDAETTQMKRLTLSFFHLFAPLRDPAMFMDVNAALSEFRDVIRTALNAGSPRGSFLFELCAFQALNDTITTDQIVDNCLLVFADGVENIEAGAANILSIFEHFDISKSVQAGGYRLSLPSKKG